MNQYWPLTAVIGVELVLGVLGTYLLEFRLWYWYAAFAPAAAFPLVLVVLLIGALCAVSSEEWD